MKTLEACIATAMDCSDSEILPFLPYILQDFWELGSNPFVIADLIRKFCPTPHNLTLLDLGCGKGAVTISVARQLKCHATGIDGIPEFIAFAKAKAAKEGVEYLCRFEVGDVREKIKTAGRYDIILLGSIGQVFGNYFETLTLLGGHLKEGGVIIIDEGYLLDSAQVVHPNVLHKADILAQIEKAGMQLLFEEVAVSDQAAAIRYDAEYQKLLKRCGELSAEHPDKAEMFSSFCQQQYREYDNLKNDITCATLVIQRQP